MPSARIGTVGDPLQGHGGALLAGRQGGVRPVEEVAVVTLTFDPFREMDRLAGQMFDTATSRGPRWMRMDLYRVDDHFVVAVDLPGVDPGSIDINVDGNTLTIRAERSVRTDDGVQWLAQERPSGSFLRQLNLGDGLDVERILASYEAGALTVTIPVAEKAPAAPDHGRDRRWGHADPRRRGAGRGHDLTGR